MNDITRRFIEAYKALGLTGYRMGQVCSIITKQKISNIENGSANVTTDMLSDFFIHYGKKVNANYLLMGEGKVLKDNNLPENIPSDYQTWLLPQTAHGGSLTSIPADGVLLQNCEKIISPIKGVDFAITVYGDSMAPEYPSGSRVLIQRINPDAYIDWGKAYVLDTCNGVILKEVLKCEREGYVTCHSINPDPKYANFDVLMSDIYGMYRVLMCLSAK